MELFDTTAFLRRDLPTPAGARNCIGYVAQEFVGRVLGVAILPVDGRKEVCPDFDGGEIKSVGKNGRAIIYKWRLEKDLKHHDPENFIYCFLRHRCPITVGNATEIAGHFANEKPTLLIVTLREVAATMQAMPVRQFSLFMSHGQEEVDRRIGYNRVGYADGGWQFGLNIFAPVTQKRRFFLWQNVRQSIRVLATDGGAHAAQRFIGQMTSAL